MEGRIQAAIEDIELRGPEERSTYQEIADRFNVQRVTLSRRYRRAQGTREAESGDQMKTNPQQEHELAEYVKVFSKRGLTNTRDMVQNLAAGIAKEHVGEGWVRRFVKRHNVNLISHWTDSRDNVRYNADSEAKHKAHFHVLHSKMEGYGIEARHTYNMDEKGFTIGKISRTKRIFFRRQWEIKKATPVIQDGSKEWASVVACICIT